MFAGVALFPMTAQGGGATGFDGVHCTALRARQRRSVLDTIRLTVAAQHMRHLQREPRHGKERLKALRRGCWRRQRMRQQIQRAFGRADLRGGDTQVTRGRGQRPMPHQQLNGAQIGARF